LSAIGIYQQLNPNRLNSNLMRLRISVIAPIFVALAGWLQAQQKPLTLVVEPGMDHSVRVSSGLTSAEFIKLMEQVSLGWNEGDAKKAADCFSGMPNTRLLRPLQESAIRLYMSILEAPKAANSRCTCVASSRV
jgi:hypothetical protein